MPIVHHGTALNLHIMARIGVMLSTACKNSGVFRGFAACIVTVVEITFCTHDVRKRDIPKFAIHDRII